MNALSKIAERLDPDEIVDRLNITSEELVLILADQILENLDEFYDIIQEDE